MTHYPMRRTLCYAILVCMSSIIVLAQTQTRHRKALDPEEWVYLTKSEDRIVYYRPKKITMVGPSMRQLWIKFVPRDIEKANEQRRVKLAGMNLPADRFGILSYSFTLYETNCKTREERPKATIEYDKNDKIILSMENLDLPWSVTVPETIDEKIVDAACVSR